MKTVFVGLSGGVDSAVSAHLLKESGYNVVGVFLKVWEPDFLPCTAQQDRLDAMRVAAHLEIPFRTYDLEKEYKEGVVDYFINAYKEGLTPNPDVMCNREIKFGAFWDRAKQEGADFIATGHYAQVREGQDRKVLSLSERTMSASSAYSQNIETNGTRSLIRGMDPKKDQTYFLWTLEQDDLKHVMFPIGGMEKSDVRALAEKVKLPNAEKRDSQGLCFLGHVDMTEFLQHYIPITKGEVINEKGEVVGEHDGVWFYTLDQRMPIIGSEKMYVIGKDIQENKLIVSADVKDSLKEKTYDVINLHWIRENYEDKEIEIETRYHGEATPGKVSGNQVIFEKPVRVASGQSVVFYKENECLGGAVVG